MSDTMLLGVLRMPFDLAMPTLTSRIQYHRRGVQAADEIERLTRERDEARAEVERLRKEMLEVAEELENEEPRSHKNIAFGIRNVLEGKP